MRRGIPNDPGRRSRILVAALDPGRRSRILVAALDVIRTDGISAVSYRGVAARADVPLGSMTYYFPTLEGLVLTALDSTRSELEPRYAAPLRGARSPADVVDALVDATIGPTSPSLSDIRLYEEIRHYGARDPKFAAVLQAVEDDSLVMLQPVVPTSIALAINALLWGWWSHRLAHPGQSLDESTVRRPYEAIVGLVTSEHSSLAKEQGHA